MAVRLRPARIVPWAVAGGMWTAAISAVVSGRLVPAPWDRLLDCATVCITIWAIVSRYHATRTDPAAGTVGIADSVADQERRLQAYERALRAAFEHAEIPYPGADRERHLRVVGDGTSRSLAG